MNLGPSTWIADVRGGPPAHARAPARRRGQVLVVVLLGMTALVGLAFYAYNVGTQVNRRVEMQNAADAVAISGAAWMARSMNTIAMNNCSQSRMLALVPTLDALLPAARISVDELNDWIGDTTDPAQGLTALTAGMSGPVAGLDDASRNKIRTGVDAILGRLRAQREILRPFTEDEVKDSITGATNWFVRGAGGAPPHGRLWRAAVALDEYSQSLAASAGQLAQANAVRFGQKNGVEAAFVVPIAPELPAERGSLEDFDFVLRKRLQVNLRDRASRVENTPAQGGAIPNSQWPHRLGPWARLFDRPHWYRHSGYRPGRGWRHEWGNRLWVDLGTTTEVQIPPREGRQIVGPSAGGGVAGSGASRGYGARQGGTYTRRNGYHRLNVKGYTTFGPYYWAKKWVMDYASVGRRDTGRPNLGDTKFSTYYSQAADAKLKYMFSGPKPPKIRIHHPRWSTDLAEARKIAEDELNRIKLTRYYYIEVIYKTVGGVKTVTSQNLSNPVTKEFQGWLAPEELRRTVFGGDPLVTQPVQLGSLPMWMFTAQGVEQRISPEGKVIEEWPVEFVWYFIFTGVDIGGELEIGNPSEREDDEDLPAPWVFRPAAREAYTPDPDRYADGGLSPRRESFAFLGVVRKETSAPVWSTKFTTSNPLESIVAVAQAKLLNNQQ